MKITMVFGPFLPVPPIMGGAVEKVGLALAKEFVRRGHEVFTISRTVPQFPRSEVCEGVSYLRLPGFDAPRSLLWLKLLDLIYSIRVLGSLPEADIVVTHTFWLPILLRNSKHGKIYVHVGRYPKGQMRFYRHVGRLQAPTQAQARAIAEEIPDRKSIISVVPNPAPQPHNAGTPPSLDMREKTLLFVGRVHPEKGVHILIEAFASDQGAFAGWQLVIVGPAETKLGGGGEEYLVDLKRRAGSAAVVFRGPIFDQIALEEEFRSARAFVYPSLAERGETFGLAALEGMAHGCAVFVSDLGCFHDFIRDGDTGFVFNHRARNPVESLREKMANAVADPTLLARVAEAGYRVSADYSIARVADKFLDDFNSLLAESDASSTSR